MLVLVVCVRSNWCLFPLPPAATRHFKPSYYCFFLHLSQTSTLPLCPSKHRSIPYPLAFLAPIHGRGALWLVIENRGRTRAQYRERRIIRGVITILDTATRIDISIAAYRLLFLRACYNCLDVALRPEVYCSDSQRRDAAIVAQVSL